MCTRLNVPLQIASEGEVKEIQARMAEKLSELSAATTAKHMADTQVEDLQRRILALQRLSAAAGQPLEDSIEVRVPAYLVSTLQECTCPVVVSLRTHGQ